MVKKRKNTEDNASTPQHEDSEPMAAAPEQHDSIDDSDNRSKKPKKDKSRSKKVVAQAIEALDAPAVTPAAPVVDVSEALHDSPAAEEMLLEKVEPLRPPMQTGEKGEKVRRALPAWIANPRPISTEVASACVGEACDRPCTGKDCLNYAASPFPVEDAAWLSETLKQSLHRQKIEYLFPVQAAVGPALCNGFHSYYTPGDVCVSAPTGSGKTLAYVLPILECLRTRVVRRLRCLVVLPTKDLVNQVSISIYKYI